MIIEENVEIYMGAKILGAIIIGCGSKIGLESVVIRSIPPNSLVAGNPGKIEITGNALIP